MFSMSHEISYYIYHLHMDLYYGLICIWIRLIPKDIADHREMSHLNRCCVTAYSRPMVK